MQSPSCDANNIVYSPVWRLYFKIKKVLDIFVVPVVELVRLLVKSMIYLQKIH